MRKDPTSDLWIFTAAELAENEKQIDAKLDRWRREREAKAAKGGAHEPSRQV